MYLHSDRGATRCMAGVEQIGYRDSETLTGMTENRISHKEKGLSLAEFTKFAASQRRACRSYREFFPVQGIWRQHGAGVL